MLLQEVLFRSEEDSTELHSENSNLQSSHEIKIDLRVSLSGHSHRAPMNQKIAITLVHSSQQSHFVSAAMFCQMNHSDNIAANLASQTW